MCGFHLFLCFFGRPEKDCRGTLAEVLLRSFTVVGSQVKSDDTMNLFQQMQQECVKPDRFTFIEVLKACGSLQALEDGRNIHTQITQSDCASHIFVGNSLVDMYVKCGSLEAAWKVFNSMHTHGIIAWNALILGHLACGQAQKVLA